MVEGGLEPPTRRLLTYDLIIFTGTSGLLARLPFRHSTKKLILSNHIRSMTDFWELNFAVFYLTLKLLDCIEFVPCIRFNSNLSMEYLTKQWTFILSLFYILRISSIKSPAGVISDNVCIF